MALRLHNSLTRRLEDFLPLEPGRVRMYHCGPTVYDYAHIGNFRSFLFADLLRRYLEYRGYEVFQVMNITDVGHMREDGDEGEDKIEARARAERVDPWRLAAKYTEAFFADLEALGVRRAHVYPRATEHIPEMIAQIQRLLERGHAYVVGGAVYYDVDTFPRYGRLSGNTLEQLRAGARIEPHPDKRHPYDFALWKADPRHRMKWPSPWGPHGYPGWHIECSAMAMKYLGETFDIHTGGEDNKFPHHECEIAQAEGATGKPFVRYWLHVKHLLVDGEKMSKSRGNFYTVRDLLRRGYAGTAIRYALLGTHYRSGLNFTLAGLAGAARTVERLVLFRHWLAEERPPGQTPGVGELVAAARRRFQEALDDDLNVSPALAAVHELAGELRRRDLKAEDAARARAFLEEVDRVMGLFPPRSRSTLPDTEVERLVRERDRARRARDYARADAIREDLRRRGILLEDRPDGTRWHRVP